MKPGSRCLARAAGVRAWRIRWLALSLALALAGAPGSPAGPVPARDPQLDPTRLRTGEGELPGERLGRLLAQGRYRAAQRLASAWRYNHPSEAPRPVLRLIQRVYELDRSADRRRHGALTLSRIRGREFEVGIEDLGRFHQRAAAAVLGGPPPPVTVHVVETLDPGFRGLQFAGHVAVSVSGGPTTARHELVHFLLELHPVRAVLRGRHWWLNEGLAELLSRRGDPRLALLPPLREKLPRSPTELFPRQGTWRGDPEQPDLGYLGGYLAARMLFGERPLESPRVAAFLKALVTAPGSFRQRFDLAAGRSLPSFEKEWRRRLAEEFSVGPPTELPPPPGKGGAERLGWPHRAAVLSRALRGDLEGALRVLAELHHRAGAPPGWLLNDSTSFARAVGRDADPGLREALESLYHLFPHAGLLIHPELRDEEWGRQVLGRVLAEDPSEKELLFTTLIFHRSAWREAVERAWRRVEERSSPAWTMARGMRAAFLGRLEPSPDGYEGVHRVLEDLAASLDGDVEVEPELYRAFMEARAAYAFGAGEYEVAARVVEEEREFFGPRSRLFLNLGSAYFHQEEYRRAREAYQQGLFLDPDYPGLRLGLGATLAKLGELVAARDVLSRARVLEADQERVVAALARVAEAEGEEAEAAELWAEARELGWEEEAHEVPAEFRVMVYTTLSSVLPPDPDPEGAGEPSSEGAGGPGPETTAEPDPTEDAPTRAPPRPGAEGSR